MDISSVIQEVKTCLSPEEIVHGESLFFNNDCVILSQSAIAIDFMITLEEGNKYIEYNLIIDEGERFVPEYEKERTGWNSYSYACLLQYESELKLLEPKEQSEHKKYSREGMIKRVLEERRTKALKADYRIKWANNIYGDHVLTNENGIRYKIFFRDFEKETGYSDSADAKVNKLGTTKHIMYAFSKFKEDPGLFRRLSKKPPFIEIYCDPLNDYKITWFYPGELSDEEKLWISKYFKNAQFIEDKEIESLLPLIKEASEHDTICIRPEVKEKIERHFENLMFESISKSYTPDFSPIKATLFPYQIEGVNFALFKRYAIIADEMGLGKTIQAIATAILKKQIFGFRKTLIACPATLKSQWKKEIEKFTDEKALIVSGFPDERERQYLSNDYFFFIVNYETILRDSQAIRKAGFDFLILDEAQKIKNYETKTSSAIKRLNPKHTLVITGTPIENRLIDIFSIVSVLDPYFFGPLWEFSYQHCLFDAERPNKINGYYNLKQLNSKISDILIRREKQSVLNQLPTVQQFDIPIGLSPLQQEYHGSYMKALSRIIRKKFLTPYDLQKITLLLANARMVCDSTYLIDEETNESPKLDELEYILFEKLDIKNTPRKIIIFSEWVKVHKLIGQILRKHNIGFVELNGKVPVKLRGELIKKFESKPECQIFLSTEAGGAGLNLQAADILINFELPWNPAKKNQRIGRIDRLGQKSKNLTIYNFISKYSIEQNIAAGLLVKQSLFEGVLSENSTTNYLDISSKGRSQFILQIEALVAQQEQMFNAMETEMVHESVAEQTPTEQPVSDPTDLQQLELFEESASTQEDEEKSKQQPTSTQKADVEQQREELEQVMNSGMQFLAGLFKMSTGKELNTGGQKIEIDQETGEIVMRFKIG